MYSTLVCQVRDDGFFPFLSERKYVWRPMTYHPDSKCHLHYTLTSVSRVIRGCSIYSDVGGRSSGSGAAGACSGKLAQSTPQNTLRRGRRLGYGFLQTVRQNGSYCFGRHGFLSRQGSSFITKYVKKNIVFWDFLHDHDDLGRAFDRIDS